MILIPGIAGVVMMVLCVMVCMILMLVMVTGMMCDVDIDDDGMMKSKYYKYVFTDIDNSF